MDGLPDPASAHLRNRPSERERTIEEYAQQSGVSGEWVRKRLRQGRLLALSYVGIPVEMANQPWGVIVLDSKTPTAKTGDDLYRAYSRLARILERVLEWGVSMQHPGSGWIWLEPSQLVRATTDTLDGVQVTLMVSPYDLPEAVRGFYDTERQRFRIQFRYLSDEPIRREPQDEVVALCLGENSGRIHEIEIDVGSVSAAAVSLSIQAIEKLEAAAHAPARPDNYQVARDLLTQFGSQLVGGDPDHAALQA